MYKTIGKIVGFLVCTSSSLQISLHYSWKCLCQFSCKNFIGLPDLKCIPIWCMLYVIMFFSFLAQITRRFKFSWHFLVIIWVSSSVMCLFIYFAQIFVGFLFIYLYDQFKYFQYWCMSTICIVNIFPLSHSLSPHTFNTSLVENIFYIIILILSIWLSGLPCCKNTSRIIYSLLSELYTLLRTLLMFYNFIYKR